MAPKPFVLAVETSSRIGSVAVAFGEKMLAETAFSAPIRHSAEIFPAIRCLLNRFSREPKEIEQIYISIGPGSFTGLRIATTFAKTMHLANAVKIVTVDTLDIIAANVINLTAENTVQDSSHQRPATSDERVAAILDAKRGQFFIAVYKRNTGHESRDTSDKQRATSDGIWQKILPDSLMTASEFLEKFRGSNQPIWLLGDGLLYYKDKFKAQGVHFCHEKYWSPRAGKVHLLGWKKALGGQFAKPVSLQPLYLRAPDVKLKRQ
ncbi:MAG: tRNA (adenosine(37)-N6)-threonylcarbamoyltransferase complex dimerization subunit type 1 TsaB [Planctomycetota bacterium]|jgi:tRNA threonylcarbamoyl adenosine modification protein YeaZ